ncbi:hypothetical protein LIP_1311 [Limnochorda pilosa]|uniref:Uncharacterized protein n=1 Tax=Limnochorda pilosa TaxID=1555112 RepID=A0A0K2SJA9_LIMPI|nr:hypothetical protein LIP_1311 [Limnochorda pilosa]
MTGFEPATFGATTRRSNRLSYTHHVRAISSVPWRRRSVKAAEGGNGREEDDPWPARSLRRRRPFDRSRLRPALPRVEATRPVTREDAQGSAPSGKPPIPLLARLEGFEPPAVGLEGHRSIP